MAAPLGGAREYRCCVRVTFKLVPCVAIPNWRDLGCPGIC